MFSALTLLALLALPPAASAQPQTPARDDTRVLVSRFVVTGVTVFPMDKLRPLLAPAEGRELTLGQIEAVAAQVTALYREHGYILARAYVLAAPIDVNVGRQVNVNAAGSIFNPPGPVIGMSINMAGVDVDDTLHFPTTVTGQIFWNGALLWPLAPPVPVGRAAAAAATAALQAGTPACDNPLAASGVASEARSVLCHPAPTPSQSK